MDYDTEKFHYANSSDSMRQALLMGFGALALVATLMLIPSTRGAILSVADTLSSGSDSRPAAGCRTA